MIDCATLGEVADVVSGVGFPKVLQGNANGEVPVFKVGDISSAFKSGSRYLRRSPNHLSHESARQLAAKLMPAGTIVFAKIGEGLKLNRRAVLAQPSLVDNNVMGLIPKADYIASSYLYYFMQTVDLGKLSRATAVPSVRRSDVVALSVPLPSLLEQEGIVSEIEKQFSRLDGAVANLQRVKANLKRYKASVLKDAVEGRLAPANAIASDGEGCAVWVPLSRTIKTLDQGWSPQCESKSRSSSDEWAVIKTTAIQPMEFQSEENKLLPLGLMPRANLGLMNGDLLITRAGPRTRVGVTSLVKSDRPRLMLCDKAYRLRAKLDVAIPAFLEVALNSPALLDRLDELKSGISDSGVNLTQRRFGELLVPLPSLAEQQRIVDEVDRRLSLARVVESEVDANIKKARALQNALLTKVFGGKE